MTRNGIAPTLCLAAATLAAEQGGYPHEGRHPLRRGTGGHDASLLEVRPRARLFNRPTDIAFTKNGDFYVSDGCGNSRVVKFTKDGKYLLDLGQEGNQARRIQYAALGRGGFQRDCLGQRPRE
jgi:hypothetical protein